MRLLCPPPPPFPHSKNSPWRHRTVRLCFPLHDTALNAEKFTEGFVASQTLPTKQMRCRILITIGTIITLATGIHPMAHLQVTVMVMVTVQGMGIQRVLPVLPGTGQVVRRTQHRVQGPQTHLITTSKNQDVNFTYWVNGFSREMPVQYYRLYESIIAMPRQCSLTKLKNYVVVNTGNSVDSYILDLDTFRLVTCTPF